MGSPLFLTALIVTFIASVQAFWRLECDGSTALARLDPLMAFGHVSDHVHSIKGGSGFGASSTSDDLLKSKCTSCGVKEDLSAYWSPALYFMHDDGTVEVVPEKPPHKSYYLLHTGLTASGNQQKVEPFPNGFQMIAGSNFNRNSTLPDPDPTPLGPWPNESQEQRAQRALGFNCLHYQAGNDEPTLRRHGLPTKEFMDQNCADGIRLELMFPSCWNGQKDSAPPHKSHVAYPDGVLVGNCPKGFDRRLPSLMFETIVATDYFKGKAGKFVFANGDPTGYGYHGDFIAAWQGTSLADAIKACDQQLSSGNMRECPVFTMTQNSADCKLDSPLPGPIQKENVKGPMKGLVNGLQVFNGPGPAPKPGPPAGGDTSKAGKQEPAPKPHTPASPKEDQNVVPTAAFSSLKAPPGTTLPAEPNLAGAHKKVVVKPSQSSANTKNRVVTKHVPAASPPPPFQAVAKPVTTPAPAGAQPPHGKVLSTVTTTSTVTLEFNNTSTGQPETLEEVVIEEIVYLEVDVPKGSNAGKAARDVSPHEEYHKQKREEHLHKHQRGHAHHLGRR